MVLSDNQFFLSSPKAGEEFSFPAFLFRAMNYSTLSIFADQKNLTHAILKRYDGTSKPPYDSLNVSFGVSDNAATVLANRGKIKETFHLENLISAGQIHSNRILIVDSKPKTDLEEGGYDALITNIPQVALMIQQADCQAVMLFDPIRKVIANIHSGWKGTSLNIIAKTIQTMTVEFASAPADILAGISPSLGPCCAEFINYKTELPTHLHKYQQTPNYFDFWAISQDQLIAAGVTRKNIEIAKICTMCNHDYFSYRRKKTTGRFGSIIALR